MYVLREHTHGIHMSVQSTNPGRPAGGTKCCDIVHSASASYLGGTHFKFLQRVWLHWDFLWFPQALQANADCSSSSTVIFPCLSRLIMFHSYVCKSHFSPYCHILSSELKVAYSSLISSLPFFFLSKREYSLTSEEFLLPYLYLILCHHRLFTTIN